jgi:hypothetical protein
MAGQFRVRPRTGVVEIAQVALTVLVMAVPQRLRPLAVEMLVVKQFVGVK